MSLEMPIDRVGAAEPAHRPLDAAAAAGDVVQVHRLADDQVAVGVEPPRQLVAVMLEVALDLELLPQPERVAHGSPVGELPTEPVGEHVVAAERHLGHHAGHGRGPRGGLRRARRRSSRRRRHLGSRRIARRPIAPQAICCAVACIHVAIGAIDRTRCGYMTAHSSTCIPPIDPPTTACQRGHAERVGEASLGAHHVADRDDGEPRAVRLAAVPGNGDDGPVDPWQPPSTLGQTTNQRSVSIGQAGTDDLVPPAGCRVTPSGRPGGMAVAGPGVAEQHGIRPSALSVPHVS